MSVLCEHAHSDNPALCLNALWALKHFIHAVEPDLKRACLERLEPGWLVQLIRDDTQDASLSHARMKGVAGDDMDEDVDTSDTDEPLRWVYGVNGVFHELDTSESARLQEAENRLAAIRESELNPARRARNDDVAIQEQGLDFIRNIIGHPGPGTMSDTPNEAVEMVDYLFSELGQDRLFDILASKLRPKVLSAFSRRTSVTGRDARIVYPQAQIIVPVIYILVHIAASDTRHKQLIVAQTELLKLLAQNALSKDRDVRAALCHLVANLTMQDENGESDGCRPRAAELKKLGFLNKMEMLRQEDRDLDVRERAKQAAWHLEQALLQSY
jgi:armadillo repeat-containing protein 8